LTTYPAEPWELRGQLYGAVFRVPVRDIAARLPDGWRPVQLGGVGIVGAVWVEYEPGGVLSYRELMTTLLVRRGWRLVPTVTHIWVDSVASRDGGRALWGIPKELAGFAFGPGTFSARDDTGAIAQGTVRRRVRLPGRWPVRFTVVQQLGGRAKLSPVRSTARVELCGATFTADPSGPLAFLTGRRPLLAFALREFRMRFGG
jgi:hypothetical protein